MCASAIDQQTFFESVDIDARAENRRLAKVRTAGAHAGRLARSRGKRSDPVEFEFYARPVAKLHTAVPDGTVDLVCCDPPYPGKFLDCYDDLGAFAARALRDGGTLLAMAGTTHLPSVMERLGRHLDYHWTLCWVAKRAHAQNLGRRTHAGWKSVLWYQKGKYDGPWQYDLVEAPPDDDDRKHHYWGQSVGGFDDLLGRFASPSTVVCDPFLGGGTTAVAAAGLGCRFIGSDIDPDAVSRSRENVRQFIDRQSVDA